MTYKITSYMHYIDDGQSFAYLTLENEYGGCFHITDDDHCYVLRCDRNKHGAPTTIKVYHWFPEAVAALKLLPSDPRSIDRPLYDDRGGIILRHMNRIVEADLRGEDTYKLRKQLELLLDAEIIYRLENVPSRKEFRIEVESGDADPAARGSDWKRFAQVIRRSSLCD